MTARFRIVAHLTLALLGGGSGTALGWEFPAFPLAKDNPWIARALSPLQLGNGKATAQGFPEADETLIGAFAYLHPQSPMAGNPAALSRLLTLLGARFDQWERAPDSMTDMASTFQTAFAFYALREKAAARVPAAQNSKWTTLSGKLCQTVVASDPAVFDRKQVGGLWLNGEIRLALGAYFGGLAAGDKTCAEKAAAAIDNVMLRTVMPDGGTHYCGFQNEAGYHLISACYLLWYGFLTGSQPALDAVKRTRNYYPITVEPAGFDINATYPAWKHYFNQMLGKQNALLLAYLTGDGYNYAYGKDVEGGGAFPGEGSGLLLALTYRSGITAKPLPTGYSLLDRNVQGPRGRFGDWAWVGTTRDPSASAAGEEEPRRGCGKSTFVGAVALEKGPYPLNASLDGATLEAKNSPGPETSWQRGEKYISLAMDEQNSLTKSGSVWGLATQYRISDKRDGGDGPFTAIPWLGRQEWLFTESRLVGMLEMEAVGATTVYGLDARLRLVSGRNGLGVRKDLVRLDSSTWAYGNLRIRIHSQDFAGGTSTQYVGTYDEPGDTKTGLLRLHDAKDARDDKPIAIPAGYRKYCLVECLPAGKEFAGRVERVDSANPSLRALEVQETGRKLRLVHNITSAPFAYAAEMAAPFAQASLRLGWDDTRVLPQAVIAGKIRIAVIIPAHQHILVANSAIPADHAAGYNKYEDLFPGSAAIPETIGLKGHAPAKGGDAPRWGRSQDGWRVFLPAGGPTELTILNLQGRTLRALSGDFAAGWSELPDLAEYGDAGRYGRITRIRQGERTLLFTGP